MEFVKTTESGGVFTICLHRGKVNALNGPLLAELNAALGEAEANATVRAVVLTGSGKFFSFGFDIPEFLSFPKQAFKKYLAAFSELYARIFLFPKPVIASLNGHTIAGGCMMAIACDYRIMNDSEGRISLNEITFGSSVFAGSVHILKELVGARHARDVLYSGKMYTASEALGLGLIDAVAPASGLEARTLDVARTFAEKDPAAFASIKRLLRAPVAEGMWRFEGPSIEEFVDIWYSEKTWAKLQAITIKR